MSYPLNALRSRGMLAALTHQDAGVLLDRLLKCPKTSDCRPAVYCGFDPTAESLHVGNLLQGIALRHFQMAGFRPILLVGGATGMIGDPSGKSEDRVLLSDDVVRRNASNIIQGLSPVLDFTCPNTGAVVYDNADWHNKMSAIEWMRDVGRHFRVNSMLTRDSVRSRLSSDQGISFLEFSYQLFQAYDFLHLYRHHNCVVQIGGSDQWGNIISGCELIRKSLGQDAFGVTLPLLTTSSGEKYGKSAGNAIWLDAKKTSVFDFYQYFLRADDRDVAQLLHSFTFFKNEAIQLILDTHKRKPEDRTAQKTLAETVTTMIHGTDALKSALSATTLLFGKGISNERVSASQVMSMAGDAPVFQRSRLDVIGRPLVDVATSIGATKSKAECKRLIKGGGVYINKMRVNSDTFIITETDLVDDTLLVLRTGRRNNFIIQLI